MTTDVLVEDRYEMLVAERDRFAELAGSPFLELVVAANRLYLTAAVADALPTRRERWALSCLPTTGGESRFSTMNMGGQETFAVFKPLEDGVVTAHVLVTASVLDASGKFWAPGVGVFRSPYVAGGPDQVEVFGPWQTLAPALAAAPLRTAARDFARRLMTERTKYSRFHDEALAARALGLR